MADNEDDLSAALTVGEFRKWTKDQSVHGAQKNMRTWGFNIFVIGMATLSLALALLQQVDLNEVTYLQLLGLSFVAMILGVMLIFLSPWAADREDRLKSMGKGR